MKGGRPARVTPKSQGFISQSCPDSCTLVAQLGQKETNAVTSIACNCCHRQKCSEIITSRYTLCFASYPFNIQLLPIGYEAMKAAMVSFRLNTDRQALERGEVHFSARDIVERSDRRSRNKGVTSQDPKNSLTFLTPWFYR